MAKAPRCGYAAIVGRPNVGKSTLLNHLIGQKLSITSRKPQTTRHPVLGISTRDDAQLLFVDTPGVHGDGKRALNRFMNRAAISALAGVDVIVMVVDRGDWRADDDRVLRQCREARVPAILAVNKIDLAASPDALLPVLARHNERGDFAAIIPLSARRDQRLDVLQDEIVRYLPEGPFLFEKEALTDRSTRFLVAEIVREKIIRQLGDELPYATTVEIEAFSSSAALTHIAALIVVERQGQKAILIGHRGQRLRQIGQQARRDIERLLDARVMLKLWVKVRSAWADDERALRSLGYEDAR